MKITYLLLFPMMYFYAVSNAAVNESKQFDYNFYAEDMPYDSGTDILLSWKYKEPVENIIYKVYASANDGKKWKEILAFKAEQGKKASKLGLPFWAQKYDDSTIAIKTPIKSIDKNADIGTVLSFKLEVLKNKKSIYTSPKISTSAKDNWFNLPRLNGLMLLIGLIIFFFCTLARAKKKGLFIRRIAGLDAIDEAIGRATEMGKPIFYSTGIGGMSGVNTIASLSILGEVSRKVAEYDSIIKVPHYDPIVMSVAKETVKQAYFEAGRPDSYKDDCNFFLSSDQFSYAASMDGMIEREKPAACFFMGYFMAESLLLTEVGASTGAIQIAATDSESQLPFFFTSCDYTLIGEELYAAGAYLSKEPMLLSVLKLQDFGKLLMMISVLAGGSLIALAALLHYDALVNIILNIFTNY